MDGMDDEIQLTLPSNSSIGFFPENKPGLYHTKLSSSLNLEGDWEAALMEIQYPHNWHNIIEDIYFGFMIQPHPNTSSDKLNDLLELYTATSVANLQGDARPGFPKKDLELMQNSALMKTGEAVATILRIPAGYYHTVEEFVERINIAIRDSFRKVHDETYDLLKGMKLEFVYDRFTKLVHYRKAGLKSIQFYCKNYQFLNALQLESIDPDSYFYRPPLTTFRKKAFIDRTSTLFIYSDIIKYQFVGDTQAALIGVCPVTGQDGEQRHYVFNPPFFIPLNTQSISSLEIKIADEYGDIVQFDPTGKVLCRIILRRRPRRW